jgi:hypothetical protein
MIRRPAKTFVTLALLAGAALLSTTDARAEPRRGKSSTWLRVDNIWSQQDGRRRKRMAKPRTVPDVARPLRVSLKIQYEGL